MVTLFWYGRMSSLEQYSSKQKRWKIKNFLFINIIVSLVTIPLALLSLIRWNIVNVPVIEIKRKTIILTLLPLVILLYGQDLFFVMSFIYAEGSTVLYCNFIITLILRIIFMILVFFIDLIQVIHGWYKTFTSFCSCW